MLKLTRMKIENLNHHPAAANGPAANDSAAILPQAPPLPDSLFKLGSLCSPPHSRARTGKIARLPAELRDGINTMLRHGSPYSAISEKLAASGHPGITPANISNWKFGGFADWLDEQQRLEARLALPKALERCGRSNELDRLQQNALALACEQLAQILSRFDINRALALLYEKPQLLPAFIGALAALGRSSAELTRAFEISQNCEHLIRRKLQPSAIGTPNYGNGNGRPHLDEDLKTLNPTSLDSNH